MPTYDEHIDIRVDDQDIAGTLITPGTLIPGVLFVHGWGGSQEQYLARAHEIAALGCICLTFDLRGHAQTRTQYETVSREQNLADLLAAYDLLTARHHVDPAAIAVIGSSYGGYLASVLTTMRRVKWLALRAPALYIDAGWGHPKLQLHKEHDLRGYRQSFVAAEGNRALTACQAFEGDVLLIESAHDDIIPATVLKSYREACKHARSLTYRCMPDADHGLTTEKHQQAYTTLLTGWMSEMISGTRAGSPARPRDPVPAAPEVPPDELS